MSKFDEFMKAQENADNPIKGTVVEGGFQCQSCYEPVDEAEYFQNSRLLRWKCEYGHTSYIEEFML